MFFCSRKRGFKDLINKFEKKIRQQEKERKKIKKIGHGDCTLSKSTITTSVPSKACRQKIVISNDDIDNIDTVNDFSDKPNIKIPEKVMNVTDSNGQLEILMKWRGIEELELIPANEVNLKWPQIVIKYYEENIIWIPPLEI